MWSSIHKIQKNWQNPPQSLLDLISDYSKVVGFEVTIQKSIAFPYTNNEKWYLKLKIILYVKQYHKMKCLGINLTKYIQDLYEESYNTLMNKIKEELNKWRYTPCSWVGRLNIVKISVLPNLIYRFNAIPIKLPSKLFCGYQQNDLKVIWSGENPRIADTIPKGRIKLEDWHYLDSRLTIKL